MIFSIWQDQSDFSERVASDSLWQMLSNQFGVNSWAGGAYCRSEKGVVSIGTTASGEKIAFVIEIVETASSFTLESVFEGLTAFPKIFAPQAQKPLYGLIAVVKFPRSVTQKIQRAGLYRAELDAETSAFKCLLPPSAIKDFNCAQTRSEN